MPRAEVGSTKHLANKLKSKGLQRLRWYCQPCEKQCRDENGFKCHTQSESHVRQMMLIGSGGSKVINDYSQQFISEFIRQLRTAHGTKSIHINHFYQEYIANKEHVHMNSTKWKNLTEFAKHLGREGICRVEETEKGLHIAWIDNSPEALRRQEAIRKRDRMDKGDEEIELKLIQDQVDRAHAKRRAEEEASRETHQAGEHLQRKEGEKISFSFGSRKPLTPPNTSGETHSTETDPKPGEKRGPEALTPPAEEITKSDEEKAQDVKPAQGQVSMSFGGMSMNKPKNVFAVSKKNNPLAQKKTSSTAPPKKMSEAERIMREEMDQKKRREERAFTNPLKKQRVS